MQEKLGICDNVDEVDGMLGCEISWHGVLGGTMMLVRHMGEGVETPTLPDGRIFYAKGGEVTVAMGRFSHRVGSYTRLVRTPNIGPQKIVVYLHE